MRDSGKPFVLIRRGRFLFNIQPRNALGWMQTGIWMALFAPAAYLFQRYAAGLPEGPALTRATVIFLLFTMVWAVCGTAWMKARAEVVDAGPLLRRSDSAKPRNGRRGRQGNRPRN